MSKAAFFRQSGWLMVANVTGGMMMWGVHFFSKKIPDAEYSAFGALLSMTMVIPALPLQMVFAQQTAAALATDRRAELARMIRVGWGTVFLVWLVAAGVVGIFRHEIAARWGLSNPAGLWVVLLVWLACAWTPMFWGVVQGRQDFPCLGWSMILSGVGRLGGTALIVLVLGGLATGIMTAAAIGYGLALALAIWSTRDLWTGRGRSFDGRGLLRQVVPLMLGFGAFQFLFSSDTMFVKAWFPEDHTASYVAAGTLSRALMWFVLPLAAVMFPKIVHSTARAEKTDLLAVTLLGTGVLALGGAAGLCVLAPWVVPFVFKASWAGEATRLIPWYAGAMVPLAMANVLLNNLLARGRFAVTPWLVGLALAYPVALSRFHGSYEAVLRTLGIFCVMMLALCAWFTLGGKVRSPKPEAPR